MTDDATVDEMQPREGAATGIPRHGLEMPLGGQPVELQGPSLPERALDAARSAAARRQADDEAHAQRELEHNRAKLQAALGRYLGLEAEVPAGQDWLELDGLLLWWGKGDPYVPHSWHVPYSEGALYVGRHNPGCKWLVAYDSELRPAVLQGHAHVDWTVLQAGSPDFDLTRLGEWLGTPLALDDPAAIQPACKTCQQEQRRVAEERAQRREVKPLAERLEGLLAELVRKYGGAL